MLILWSVLVRETQERSFGGFAKACRVSYASTPYPIGRPQHCGNTVRGDSDGEVAHMPEWRPGSLVKARERDWIVLPQDEPEVIRLRPIDGDDAAGIGIHLQLEPDALSEATYALPDPDRARGSTPGRLLHDAARLRLRSGAGPFRSMGHLSVSPRPYQLVPLIMALRLDPVRLLIADDVGVGKTIEAALIARELLDRGVIKRIGVLCPPHLCEQWVRELDEKFHIEAALVQPSQMARLERHLPRPDLNVFQYYRHMVASIDFMKSERYRDTFLQNAPDLIIVDEAHAAARPRSDRGGAQQQQRHELLRRLAESAERSIILATATPHSGIEESFRSLLGLLDPALDRPEIEPLPRDHVARRFVQRKRSDLRNWLGNETPFPERESEERPYTMTPEYVRLYEDVRRYCQELVSTGSEVRRQQQRVRYWAATAILRCLLSSPAAAEAMLRARRERNAGADLSVDDEALDPESLMTQVLDSADEEEPADYVPAASLDEHAAGLREEEIARLDQFLQRARRLSGPELDAKLAAVADAVNGLLSEGFHPIVYCRFIATAEYVATALQRLLEGSHSNLRVTSVTGGDGNSEQRREIVEDLAAESVRVLVATDCLSEGINLQQHFDAVVHYDLPWNPNRLEQREGRVDRYGQRRGTVKTLLLYGSNNAIDLTVLDVLIRKARDIRARWGFSVPVPDSDELVQAVIDSVLERQADSGQQLTLAMESAAVAGFEERLDEAAAREEESRSRFAQRTIRPDEVQRELEELEPVLGSARDVQRFTAEVLQRVGGSLRETGDSGMFETALGELEGSLQARMPDLRLPLRVRFSGPFPDDPAPVLDERAITLGRCHPIIEFLAERVLGEALLDLDGSTFFSRSAAVATRVVERRTAVFVLRLRYLLTERGRPATFAEEIVTAACTSGREGLDWVAPRESSIQLLADATPAANLSPDERAEQVRWALSLIEQHDDWPREVVDERVAALSTAHERLREQARGGRLRVEPHEPPDVLGCFVLVPVPGGA